MKASDISRKKTNELPEHRTQIEALLAAVEQSLNTHEAICEKKCLTAEEFARQWRSPAQSEKGTR